MNWKEWVDWKEKKYIAIVGFIIAYIITIPWRNYDRFFDTSQGIFIWMHLVLIVAGVIVLLILLKVMEVVVGRKREGF